MRKMPEKLQMTVGARIDETPVLFNFFLVSEKLRVWFSFPELRVLVKDKALIKNKPGV